VKKEPLGKALYALCLASWVYIKFNQTDLFYDTCQILFDAVGATGKKCGVVSPSAPGALHLVKELQILTLNKYKTVQTQMIREFETRVGNNDQNRQTGLLEGSHL